MDLGFEDPLPVPLQARSDPRAPVNDHRVQNSLMLAKQLSLMVAALPDMMLAGHSSLSGTVGLGGVFWSCTDA